MNYIIDIQRLTCDLTPGISCNAIKILYLFRIKYLKPEENNVK